MAFDAAFIVISHYVVILDYLGILIAAMSASANSKKMFLYWIEALCPLSSVICIQVPNKICHKQGDVFRLCLPESPSMPPFIFYCHVQVPCTPGHTVMGYRFITHWIILHWFC